MPITVLYNCTEVRDFLADYLERKLARRQQWAFRLHLWLCPACRRYLAKYRSSLELWRGLDTDAPPAELVELTLKFLRTRVEEGEWLPETEH
ncbi:MAG: zf-HC2 domain-containing protein [Candidatus Lambdaproteobacteria bacterium]|nr:zf-HC2 domain-containing protein [Candidatus Lambdaproteobacteria bacterium]